MAPNKRGPNHGRNSRAQQTIPEQILGHQVQVLQRTQVTEEGSFARCTSRFNGVHNHAKVSEFISTIAIYKDIEHISDANALRGLPLLLEGHAATWWTGVQREVTTWQEAMSLIQATFAPRRPAHQVYMEVFRSTQTERTPTDVFVSQRRALLAELATPHPEHVQIDMVYGLLRFHLRERIPRESVTGFMDLVRRAREIEALEKEARQQMPDVPKERRDGQRWKERLRCGICRKPGHAAEDCRSKKMPPGPRTEPYTTARPKMNSDTARPLLRCYGCDKPGVVRSKCPTCSPRTAEGKTPVTFGAVSVLSVSAIRPIVAVQVLGEEGRAYLDTGARCSVASQGLHKLLQAKGHPFVKRRMEVALADGNPRVQELLTTRAEVILEGREFSAQFIVLPNGRDNRTLLGVGFYGERGHRDQRPAAQLALCRPTGAAIPLPPGNGKGNTRRILDNGGHVPVDHHLR